MILRKPTNSPKRAISPPAIPATINVGMNPQPFCAEMKYAAKAAAVIVAPCEKFENLRTLKINANPVAIKA